ncbi:Ribosome maturation factor RimM [Linum perenne]
MYPTVSLLRPSNLPPCHHRFPPFAAAFPAAIAPPLLDFPATQFRAQPLRSNFLAASPLHSTATMDAVETDKSGSEFVEVGYVSSVHGVHGEICLEPSTDFAELRLATARQLIGSTLLAREDDRPELEEGEFYTRDLIGMRVILKDTSTCIGTVVDVYDSGASEILRVMLYPSTEASDATEKPVPEETGSVSGRLVWNTSEFVSETRAKLKNGSLKISRDHLGATSRFHENGCHLVFEGKIAIVLVVNNLNNKGADSHHQLVDAKSSHTETSPCSFISKALSDAQTFVKLEDRGSIPLVLVCPEQQIEPLKELFTGNDFFAFDCDKVCSTSNMSGIWTPTFPGLVDIQGADVGVQISQDLTQLEETFDIVFSVEFAKSLAKQMDKLCFEAIPKANTHVRLVDKEWVDIVPPSSSPNSYELRCSIYSSINACPLDKVSMMEITE